MNYFKQRMAEIRSDSGLVAQPPKKKVVAVPQRKARTKRGYIYFATTGDSKQVKIGFATDVGSRLASLRTGNHQELHVQEVFASYFAAEKMVHERFAADRIHGEWFRLTPDIEELWDDIFDFQGRHASGDDGVTFVEDLSEVFFELEAVEHMLAHIGRPFPA